MADLQAWHAQDVHLWQYADGTVRRAVNMRKRLYRMFAADMRKRYAKIAVEDCDWRKLARNKPADKNEFDPSKRYMRIASIGMLRQLLVQAGAVPNDGAYTTTTCHVCGSIEEWDAAKELRHRCERCGAEWDQDYNAAVNLKRMAELGGEKPDSGSRDTQSDGVPDVSANGVVYVGRWAKRKANRSQKGQ